MTFHLPITMERPWSRYLGQDWRDWWTSEIGKSIDPCNESDSSWFSSMTAVIWLRSFKPFSPFHPLKHGITKTPRAMPRFAQYLYLLIASNVRCSKSPTGCWVDVSNKELSQPGLKHWLEKVMRSSPRWSNKIRRSFSHIWLRSWGGICKNIRIAQIKVFSFFIDWQLDFIHPHFHLCPDPTTVFSYGMEQRLQCTDCKKVRYRMDNADVVNVNVPAREKGKDEDGKSIYQEVQLTDCLDSLLAMEALEYACPSCSKKVHALKYFFFFLFEHTFLDLTKWFHQAN